MLAPGTPAGTPGVPGVPGRCPETLPGRGVPGRLRCKPLPKLGFLRTGTPEQRNCDAPCMRRQASPVSSHSAGVTT